jgi:hypothetical protein
MQRKAANECRGAVVLELKAEAIAEFAEAEASDGEGAGVEVG